METVILPPGGGEVVSGGEETDVKVLLDASELAATWSRYSEGESGPGPHFHEHHFDCFWVLDGRIVFEAADRRVEAEAGTFVAVPPHVVHTFRNEGPGEARFLNFHAPGMGFAEHLRTGAPFDTVDAG